MTEGTDHYYETDFDGVPETEEDVDRDLDRRTARRLPGGDVEELLQELRDLVDQARPAPLSTAVKIDRDEVMDLVDRALDRLPEDLRQARWLLKEREEFLARSQLEADEILAAARGQTERMVQRSEVMRSAEAKARRIVEQARSDAAQLRNECDDYCDQRLAQLEAVLEKTMAVVAKGRERLRPADDHVDHPHEGGTPTGEIPVVTEADLESSGFFDQDHDPVHHPTA